MTNHLGSYFWERRRELGWGLGEVAQRLGHKNTSKAANHVQRCERDGLVDDGFLRKLAALYGIGAEVVRDLIRQDRVEYLRGWEEWANQPVPISIVLRTVPGFMVAVPVPEDVTTPEQAVAHGQALAARMHKKVFVVLSRRESVGITEAGEINGRFQARPDSDPSPSMSLGRVRFLLRLGGLGEIEPGEQDGGAAT